MGDGNGVEFDDFLPVTRQVAAQDETTFSSLIIPGL